MSKTINVLLVPDDKVAELTKANIAICSYYDTAGALVRGIGLEYSDEYPELPIVIVAEPTPQI